MIAQQSSVTRKSPAELAIVCWLLRSEEERLESWPLCVQIHGLHKLPLLAVQKGQTNYVGIIQTSPHERLNATVSRLLWLGALAGNARHSSCCLLFTLYGSLFRK